ncbi:hypothetical protein C8R46DRAFT_901697 [Mycena filopes]|nr:hypothetical protein C8R46DRAFT_901697 [Mycena filopes]
MIPGKLLVCVGMPIMIRNNEATELCITKGQEATIVAWDESTGPMGQRILDTLFVELVDPPRPIQIPDLPLNVVPLMRTSVQTTLLLEDDTLLSVIREQVLALLDFAMTDYASQGKSRARNVVDLTNCKDHRAYYVALSRGTSAAGTVILQNFDEKKITSGMSGYLRQELREIELLDEITRLRFEGKLPISVGGIYRRRLIRSYLAWKGSADDPEHFHPSMRWSEEMGPKMLDDLHYDEWKPSISDKKRKQSPTQLDDTHPKRKKKKENGLTKASNPTRPSPLAISLEGEPRRPVGLVWDAQNFSCGYDASLTILANIWAENPDTWSERYTAFSPIMARLARYLRLVADRSMSFEGCRDKIRFHMHCERPLDFPYGASLTSMDLISLAFVPESTYAKKKGVCERCGEEDPSELPVFGACMCAGLSRSQLIRSPQGTRVSSWLKAILTRGRRNCASCALGDVRVRLRMFTTYQSVPAVFFVTVDSDLLIFDERLVFDCQGCMEVLLLRGIIYGGGAHFVCRFIGNDGRMWYHDGIGTGRRCVDDGMLNDIEDHRLLMRTREKQAVLLVYARGNQSRL